MNTTEIIVIGVMAIAVLVSLVCLYRVAQDEYAHGFRDGMAAQVPEDQED